MSNPTPTPVNPNVKVPVSPEELLSLLKDVNQLKADKEKREAEAKQAAASKPKEVTVDNIDWSKIDEKDVFDLSIAIPAIEQNLPNFMDVHLKDRNFVARWVSTIPQRLGPMRQAGFEYITKEDIDPDYPMAMTEDSQGHYTYGDVVALKVPKARLYPALRKNHLKSAQIQGANAVKSKLNSQINNSPSVENAFRRGALSVYEDETKEDTLVGDDLANVTL